MRPIRHLLVLAALCGPVASAMASPTACARPDMTCPEVAALLAEREGYGRFASGGLDGAFAIVTSDADSGEGTLREIVTSAASPRWIRFAGDMTIVLRSNIAIPPDVTIDGRGSAVTLHDYGLQVRDGSRNVIVTHLTIDGRFRTEKVALDIYEGARDVWANHLSLSRFIDRLVNVKTGSTDVTLSWIKFHNHNKVMLFNNIPEDNLFAQWERDSKSRVTLHHSWFVDTVQRHPRAQFGSYHIYNNLVENWDYYGMSFSLEARALVEGNMFVNTAKRPCTEPPYFDTIEKTRVSYCDSIADAPARSAYANGDIDREAWEAGKAKYGYVRDWRAFLKVRDNLYIGDAKAVLADFKPEDVPEPPYCTSYAKPDAALAARIRSEAGNVPAAAGGEAARCPLAVEAAPQPRGGDLVWRWRNYSDATAAIDRPGPDALVIHEKPGDAGQRGLVQYFYGPAQARWRVEVSFKPMGDRRLAIRLADAKAQAAALAATCGGDGATVASSSASALRPQASIAPEGDGFTRCIIEGVPGDRPGNSLRFDLMTSDGKTSYPAGRAGSGLELRGIRFYRVD